MPLLLRRRGFLALIAGLLPAALLRGGAASAVAATPSVPAAPLLPPPDQPPFDPTRLARWQAAARRPLADSADPILSRLLAAAHAGEALDVIYYGGSFPGTIRRVTPLGLFTVDGFSGIYLEARCHWREEVRTFNAASLAFEPLRLSAVRPAVGFA